MKVIDDVRKRLDETKEQRIAREGKRPWGPQYGKSGRNKPGPKPLTPERARELAAKRLTHGAGSGRPRSDKLRCFCGAMTLARAIARAHNCEEPSLKEDI
jgi:hypothetical protein